jgi:hypothetical protein
MTAFSLPATDRDHARNPRNLMVIVNRKGFRPVGMQSLSIADE